MQSVQESGSGSPCDPNFDGGVGYYLAIGGAATTQVKAHVTKEISKHNWDVKMIDHTEDMAMLSVQVILLLYMS